MFVSIALEFDSSFLRTNGCATLTDKLMLLAKKANKVNVLASDVGFKRV